MHQSPVCWLQVSQAKPQITCLSSLQPQAAASVPIKYSIRSLSLIRFVSVPQLSVACLFSDAKELIAVPPEPPIIKLVILNFTTLPIFKPLLMSCQCCQMAAHLQQHLCKQDNDNQSLSQVPFEASPLSLLAPGIMCTSLAHVSLPVGASFGLYQYTGQHRDMCPQHTQFAAAWSLYLHLWPTPAAQVSSCSQQVAVN